jgi:CDGSH-type Zn-finger protein
MRIKVNENGNYHVSGGVPLKEMAITPEGIHHYVLVEVRELPQKEDYYLCRCGQSKNAPFCDGTHAKVGFDGTEVASRDRYLERAKDAVTGETMILKEDERCAYGRFCNRDKADVWELTGKDGDPENRAEAIKGASDCPSGKIVLVGKDGVPLEEENAPEIIILQDPEKGTSAAIFVKGPIVVEAADGTEYEVRNRQTLCRCGCSTNKPFCSATHTGVKYQDHSPD